MQRTYSKLESTKMQFRRDYSPLPQALAASTLTGTDTQKVTMDVQLRNAFLTFPASIENFSVSFISVIEHKFAPARVHFYSWKQVP